MSILKSIVLSALLATPMISTATPYDLGLLDPVTHNSQGFSDDSEAAGSTFTDVWTFTLNTPVYVSSSATNAAVRNGSPLLTNFRGWIDNGGGVLDLSLGSTPGIFQYLYNANDIFLAQGNHTLTIQGTNSSTQFSAAYGGNITVGAVPVPAAVWFMGTALVGLFSFKKRKPVAAA